MELFLVEQKVKSPTGVKRETRIYALVSVVYRTTPSGNQVPDLKASPIHDWTSTHDWEGYAAMLQARGHTVRAA